MASLFLLSALRQPGAFLFPSFWAEDATVLFREAIERGPWAALALPLYGSYHTVPRLVVLAASAFPTAWAPALYALGAGLATSAAPALFARPGFRWLVPHDGLRVLAAVLFSLVPGTNEGAFALCTLNYALFTGILFLLLERDPGGRWRMGPGRALVVSFLWLSVGQGLVLAPLLAVLFALTRNRLYVACLAALVLSTLLNLGTENEYLPEERAGPAALLAVFLDNLFLRVVWVPLAGRTGLAGVMALPSLPFLLVSSLALAGAVVAVGRRRVLDRGGAAVLGAAVLGAMSVYPMIALARTYGLGILRRPEVQLTGRYALVPSVLVLVLLWTWLARPARSRLGRAAGAALLAWTTANVLSEPLYVPPEPRRPFVWEWRYQAAAIDRALAARKAGRLEEPVVIDAIHCRPRPWVLRNVTISP